MKPQKTFTHEGLSLKSQSAVRQTKGRLNNFKFNPIKRIITLYTIIFMTSFSAVSGVYDFSAENEDGAIIEYNITSSTPPYTVEVGHYADSFETLNIPTSVTYNGITYTVTSIGENAFSYARKMTAVTIPETIETIKNSAFSSSHISSIIIPNSVTSIGSYAFSSCNELKSITLPNSLKAINEYTFAYSSSLSSIDIPDSVTDINYSAFSQCTGLRTVKLGNSVKLIAAYAFYGCSSLTSITIPASVTEIVGSSFTSCSKLATVINYSALDIVKGQTTHGGVAYYANEVITYANSVTLDKTSLSMVPGESDTLTPSILARTTTDKTVTWKSTNTDVATVDANGTVKAVYIGTADIIATCGPVSDTCYVRVNPIPAESITLNKTNIELKAGETETLTAIVLPTNTTDNIIWRSSNTEIASVDKTGKITAVNVGIATISANCGSVSAKCEVYVNPVPTESISLDKVNIEIKVGESQTLIANVLPVNTTDILTWTSSNINIATVDNEGKVTAVSVGTATIIAISGIKSATCEVTVIPIPTESITLNKTNLELKIDESETLIATVLPENAGDKNVSWTSSNESVATIDKYGKVSAISIGIATITASCSNISASCEVSVMPIEAESIILNKEDIEMQIGDTFKLTAMVLPPKTTDKSVTWESSDISVATIDNAGLITAIGAGSSVITAICGNAYSICKVTVVNESGIEAIEVDENGHEVEVYNLQGVKVADRDLAPGIYIRCVGGKAEKVLVK